MTKFNKGDRVRHGLGSVAGVGTIVFLPDEIGYSNAYAVRYDGVEYRGYSGSPDGIDYHSQMGDNLVLVEDAPKASITGEQQACIEAVLKAAFASQHKDDYQQGKIRLANEIADILGWEKSE